MKNIQAIINHDCGLSPKVRRVFELKAEGKTGQEIADTLYRSIKTIDAQTHTILEKLECRNIQEAVAKASAEGWLTFKHITRQMVILAFITGFTGQLLFSDTDMRRQPLTRSYRVINRRIREDFI